MIAGGVLLFIVAIELLTHGVRRFGGGTLPSGSGVVPLAFPLLAGPGAITSVIISFQASVVWLVHRRVQFEFRNVGFKKGDIESGIPINDNASDVVISNCVINLTLDKVAAFKEIYRILRSNGRMVISDLVTSKEIDLELVNSEDWCSCIDGALTKENYIESIRKAGFNNIETLQETPYIEKDGRKITSMVIKAVK